MSDTNRPKVNLFGAAAATTTDREIDQGFFNPFDNINQLAGQSVGAESGSDYFVKLVEFVRKKLEKHPQFDLVEIPRERNGGELSYSVLAIIRNTTSLKGAKAPHNFVIYQTWIVEATGEVLRPVVDTRDPRAHFTIQVTAEDANNRYLVEVLNREIEAFYQSKTNGAAPTLYYIDPLVIPRTFNVNDENAIGRVLAESTNAVETRAWPRVHNFSDFNFVRQIGSSEIQLPVEADFATGEHRVNALGMPVYVDALVSVSIEKINASRSGPVLNRPNANRLLSQAGVMIDLVPVDVDVLAESNNRRKRDFDPIAAWAPRAVITDIQQYLTRTASGTIFTVASVAELGRDRNWARSYRGRRVAHGEVNLRDIGFLNIEANLSDDPSGWGRPVDTSAADFDDRMMSNFLDSTVARDMVISVDCPATGLQAHQTTALYNLARGGKNPKERARTEIIRSLLDATDGLIENYFDFDKEDIIVGEGEMIHTGFWYDANDRIRDIRELDNYLAIAVRLGAANPSELQHYNDTYYRTDINEMRRMSERLSLVTSAASGSVTVTGTALRVSMNPVLIEAFVKSLEEGKVPLVSRENGNGDAFVSRRSVNRSAGARRYRGGGFGRGVNRDRGGSDRGGYAADRY